ncbi:hypothetical protein LP417_22120 [Polaromonas sp. P1-6]|nr:hypothetical protein LP417_22120 [Polaromonas sp. P1-6]
MLEGQSGFNTTGLHGDRHDATPSTRTGLSLASGATEVPLIEQTLGDFLGSICFRCQK